MGCKKTTITWSCIFLVALVHKKMRFSKMQFLQDGVPTVIINQNLHASDNLTVPPFLITSMTIFVQSRNFILYTFV